MRLKPYSPNRRRMTPTVEAVPDIRLAGPRRAEPTSRHVAPATLMS